MSRSRSPLTRTQRQIVRAFADNMSDAELHLHAMEQRQQSAHQQAVAMLWSRLDDFRERHGRRKEHAA